MNLPANFDPVTGKLKVIPGLSTQSAAPRPAAAPRVSSTATASRPSSASSSSRSYSASEIDYMYNRYVTPTASSASRNSRTSRRSTNWWQTIDQGIRRFGDWIDRHIGDAIGIYVLILCGIGILCLVGWVISVWIDHGFWWALGSAVVAYIAGSIGYYALCLIGYISQAPLWVIRYIFKNIYTLLATIALVIGVAVYTDSETTHTTTTTATEVQQNFTTYTVTASVLNVRSAPSTSSSVLGVLRKGDKVQPTEVLNGFAVIDYNGQTGYVSVKYLE
ncbi:MAG: SH3 domain-containing protein [Bacteroidales bacterium]|nr:SH3 domain-containing protein [Bacteroidales bacterium]